MLNDLSSIAENQNSVANSSLPSSHALTVFRLKSKLDLYAILIGTYALSPLVTCPSR
jgi:hypothetical protein